MFIGTVDQVTAQIAELQAAGCQRWYFQLVPVDDHRMLDLIVSSLIPRFA
jgi:hypothetical protein